VPLTPEQGEGKGDRGGGEGETGGDGGEASPLLKCYRCSCSSAEEAFHHSSSPLFAPLLIRLAGSLRDTDRERNTVGLCTHAHTHTHTHTHTRTHWLAALLRATALLVFRRPPPPPPPPPSLSCLIVGVLSPPSRPLVTHKEEEKSERK